ncbi:MAG: hypothetical protein ABH879_07910 [archaeon]
MGELEDYVKKRLSEGIHLNVIRSELLSHGYLESDIDHIVRQHSLEKSEHKKRHHDSINRFGAAKEILDRIGYGFSSIQWLNILLFQTGASIFTLGIVNGVIVLFTVWISSFLHDFARTIKSIDRNIHIAAIGVSGSFLMMALARIYNHQPLFILAMLISAVSVVFYGDLYAKLLKENVSRERLSGVLKKVSHFGLIVTAASLMISAVILDYNENGYIMVFCGAALAFVLGSFMLPPVALQNKTFTRRETYVIELRFFFSNIFSHLKFYMRDRIILVLLVTASITAFVQALGNAYYGVFMYQYLKDVGFGPFRNVAIIFVLAMLASLIGPSLSHKNSKAYGKFPMLVFGTLLVSIMPFTLYYNPSLMPIAMASILAVIGGSMAGFARGLLTMDLIPERHRRDYFKLSGIIATIPYLIAIPIGAYVAQVHNLRTLFLILGMILALIVVPLYFLIILLHHNKRVV